MDTLLVFGARNLGRVLARDVSAEDWRVAAFARSESPIEQLKDEVADAHASQAPAAGDDG